MRIIISMLIVIWTRDLCIAMPLQVANMCEALPHYVASHKHTIGENVYFFAEVGGYRKHFKIAKGWGSDFSLSARVIEKSQATAIYDAFEALGFGVSRYTPSSDLAEALPLPTIEGPFDLFIPITTKKTLPEVIQSLGGKLVDPHGLIPKNLDSTDEMRRWVFWSFAGLKQKRSKTESDLLFSFRTSGYKAIQTPLREGKGNIPSFLTEKVSVIDQAIHRGTLDRKITIFHANPDPALEEIWSKGINSVPVSLPIDHAYTFASMSKTFATWWRVSQYQGKGIILEIEAVAGSHMIPMEGLSSGGAMPNWLPAASELEFLLPRNSKFVATRISSDVDGNKILHCKLTQ